MLFSGAKTVYRKPLNIVVTLITAKKTAAGRISHILRATLAILLSIFTVLVPEAARAASKAEIDTLIAHIPESFPAAPDIASESAILAEINSGTILYAKHATRSMYPASTTKLLTAYLALTRCDLTDVVEYSRKAITSLEPGSSHIGLKTGDRLSVEDSLYGLLLPSANEVANGLAEKISGSIPAFADLMNETALDLGCVNTNFINANGLHDPNHMTCAYDLYRIMLADIKLEDFIRISSRIAYVKEPDEINPNSIPMGTTNQFLKKDSEFYNPYVISGKTGWTAQAGRCLVTYAAKDGMDLICVVMNSEVPNQYLDTQKLFDYAWDHFKAIRPSDLSDSSLTGKSLSGSPLSLPEVTVSVSALDDSSRIILPDTVSPSDLTRKTQEDTEGNRTVIYRLEGYPLGSAAFVDGDSGNVYGLWNKNSSSAPLLDSITVTDLHPVSVWFLGISVVFLLLLCLASYLLYKVLTAPKEPPVYDDHQFKFF